MLFVGLTAMPCFSEEGKGITADGYKWESWGDFMKVGWVTGFWDGLEHAIPEGILFLGRAEDMYGLVSELIESEFKERRRKLVTSFVRSLELSGITCGQIVDGLDKFYKDYRNKKVLTREAVWVVRLEVKGAPEEFIDQEARILRIPIGERWNEWASLRLKNQAYREAWEEWGEQIPFTLHR